MSDSGAIDLADPVGNDGDVQSAVVALERAMMSAALGGGRTLTTMCIGWITSDKADSYGGSLVKGDLSPDAVEFVCDILRDDSGDIDLTLIERRLN